MATTSIRIGRQPQRNEGPALCEPLAKISHLLAYAYDVGGHQAGDVADWPAVIELREVVERVFFDRQPDPADVVGKVIEKPNGEIQILARHGSKLDGNGTTVVAARVNDGQVIVGNVADSHLCIVDDSIEQLPEEQYLACEPIKERPFVGEEEAERHPHTHVLSRAPRTDDCIESDTYKQTLDGGALLLCSGGLSEEITKWEIQYTVVELDSLTTAADASIQTVNDNGGSDNVGFVLASEQRTE